MNLKDTKDTKKIIIAEFKDSVCERELSQMSKVLSELTNKIVGSEVQHIELIILDEKSRANDRTFSIKYGSVTHYHKAKRFTNYTGYYLYQFGINQEKYMKLMDFIGKTTGNNEKQFNYHGFYANFLSLPNFMKKETDGESYFCSELIMHALIESNIIEDSYEVEGEVVQIKPWMCRPCDVRTIVDHFYNLESVPELYDEKIDVPIEEKRPEPEWNCCLKYTLVCIAGCLATNHDYENDTEEEIEFEPVPIVKRNNHSRIKRRR